VATLVAVNSNEAVVSVTECAFGRGLESGVRRLFYVGDLDKNVASVAVKMFSCLIYEIKKNINAELSMRFKKIMLQGTVLPFCTKKS
jgi:hypothetical protein